ncbi:hypothetical protein [Actinomadura mexicana]|uniref:Uncharacterized protein n=1 Tax=Actinomadura mexicana TaxID=134959 RepID=A0A239AJP5_9ACTN|nr:hypothetical protein [Actinomadura mexicana]SNR95896.1 hypothetical protein SAMN06265355_10928 [Actinomadura mexicana]
MRNIRPIIFVLVIVVFVYLVGDGGFISTAIGGGLAFGGYLLNQRSWDNLSEKESKKRPLIGSLILTALVTSAINCGGGEGALSGVLTGFGGTGLMLVGWLIIKHLGPEEFRGSK